MHLSAKTRILVACLSLCTQSNSFANALALLPQTHTSTLDKRSPNDIDPLILADNNMMKPVSDDVSLSTSLESPTSSQVRPATSEGNVGDAGAITNTEITSLGSDPNTWDGGDGQQKPLDELDSGAIEGLWAEALDKGNQIKRWLDNYVSRGESRLDDVPIAFIPRNIDRDYKTIEDPSLRQLEDIYGDINTPFSQISTPPPAIDGDKDFTFLSVFSKTQPSDPELRDQSVLDIGVNYERGVIITFGAFAENDGTPPQTRLKSSELTWQTWEAQAKQQNRPQDTRNLRYWHQHKIINQDTANIMTLAHLKLPENVDQIPLGADGRPLYATAGRGVWRPSPANSPSPSGEIFTRLLSTPNVKPILHMLADHNDGLYNSYPIAIHTFPRVLYDGVGVRGAGSQQREGVLIVELGRMPDDVRRGALAGGLVGGLVGGVETA